VHTSNDSVFLKELFPEVPPYSSFEKKNHWRKPYHTFSSICKGVWEHSFLIFNSWAGNTF
jgi:hypothetical protein